MADSNETAQTEGEGPEGSDKPPHARPNGKSRSRRSSGHAVAPGGATGLAHTHPHVPLPPPDSHLYAKQPGHTRKSLEDMHKFDKLDKFAMNGAPHLKHDSSSTTGSMTSSTSSDSASPSDSESWSAPSTQPPSRAPSRAPSMSAGVSGNKLVPPVTQPSKPASKPPPTAPRISPTLSAGDEKASRKGPPSVNSEGGGQKFTLKDLLGAPKLVRRSSARSTASSKKSDSDRGGRSEAGGSTVSLLKKYGVCEKVAIGKGATSVVRLAHKWDRSEEKLYAVKAGLWAKWLCLQEFRKRRKNETEKEYVKKLTAEFCISSTLHHINIVETVDLVQDEAQHWCEVMEFCPGGDLYAAIKRGGMSPSEVECCFKQILTGVAYLHSQGVAHRDIKPENLFFDMKGHLKIGDYGASTVYRLPWETTIHMSTGLCGSEPYIAPEQFLGKPYDARLVDIWACGIVYYCLHFQELPWTVAQQTDQLFAAYVSACNTPAQSACPPTINNLSPRACRPVIRKMLEPNPKMRSLIDDIIKQPWIQSIEVCHAVDKPTHQHVNAVAMAHAQVHVL
ncbi:Pkinase-domain-containing protein [Daedaleopsis nitida]|nr:Pkinase-domain-containing protein [Daedaleopsis nitida]